jgi:hypothetical protein
MQRNQFIVRATVALLSPACLLTRAGAQSPDEQPFELQSGAADQAAPVLSMVQNRTSNQVQPRHIDIGVALGDDLLWPRPINYVAVELMRQVQVHPERDKLTVLLKAAPVVLTDFEITLGDWIKLRPGERITFFRNPTLTTSADWLRAIRGRRWEMVRARIGVEIDGKNYEGLDMARHKSSDAPSPLAAPARAAIASIINQMVIFAVDGFAKPADESAPTEIMIPAPD